MRGRKDVIKFFLLTQDPNSDYETSCRFRLINFLTATRIGSGIHEWTGISFMGFIQVAKLQHHCTNHRQQQSICTINTHSFKGQLLNMQVRSEGEGETTEFVKHDI